MPIPKTMTQPATNRADHQLSQFFIRLWGFNSGTVPKDRIEIYAHEIVTQQVKPMLVYDMCQEAGYLDLIDGHNNNASKIDERFQKTESAAAPVVTALASGRPLQKLSSSEKAKFFKWLAYLGPIGPNGKQAAVDGAAGFLRDLFVLGADKATLKEMLLTTDEITEANGTIADFRRKNAPFTVELTVTVQVLWQALLPRLIANDRTDFKSIDWHEVTQPTDGIEVCATDNLPLFVKPTEEVELKLIPLGPKKILIGAPNKWDATDLTQKGLWEELCRISLSQADEFIIGQTPAPSRFAVHAWMEKQDSAHHRRRARKALLRQHKDKRVVKPTLEIAAGTSPWPTGPLDTCVDTGTER